MNKPSKKLLSSQQRTDRASAVIALNSIICSMDKDAKHRLSKAEAFIYSVPELAFLRNKVTSIQTRFRLQEKAIKEVMDECQLDKILENFKPTKP